MEIELKRVYDPVIQSDGTRILVDRLWPRAIKKESLQASLWVKEIAPSDALRKWFSHDPSKWALFQTRYFHELDHNKKVVETIVEEVRKGRVTLLYAAKDREHNNAVVLKHYIEARFLSLSRRR